MFTKNIYTWGLPLEKFLTKTEGANGRFCVADKENCFQTKILTIIWDVLSKTMWLFRVTADGAAGFVGTHEVGTTLTLLQ